MAEAFAASMKNREEAAKEEMPYLSDKNKTAFLFAFYLVCAIIKMKEYSWI